MSSSSTKQPPPHLRLHVDTATATTNGSAASPGSASSSHSSRSPRPSSSGGGGGGPGSGSGSGSGGGQNQACAACKYQRRKCNPDCPLAPYFPADQQRRFLNAHRLFGVSNIQKTLRRLDPELGPEAMRALIMHSEARAADPVNGCVGIIERLLKQIQRTELELAYVKQQIAMYRQAATADPLADPAAMMLPAAAVAGQDNAVGMDALYAVPAGAGLVFHDQQDNNYHVVKVDSQNHPPPQPQQMYNYFCYDGTSGDEVTSHDGSVQQYSFTGTGGSPAALGEQLEQQCQIEAAPFVDAFDDVKPQGLPATTELLGKPLGDVDQHMEDHATAGAPCHLELGFSSF